ncbi:MAG: two-component system response regulator [Hyphomonadaceae bacterium]
MDPRDWNICLIEPNKFEAQIVVDLLRYAGVSKIRVVPDNAAALEVLRFYPANILLMEYGGQSIDALEWTRRLRRDTQIGARKAPLFMLSKAMSRAMAENCRIAGVNALIGKPVSGQTLIATIKKVLAAPRPFIEAESYVGPCRRAGIVTAGPAQRRRKADEPTAADAAGAPPLDASIAALRIEVDALVTGKCAERDKCEAALRDVQTAAAGDGPLMRTCAAFSLQLQSAGKIDGAARAALGACMDGVAKLAGAERLAPAERDNIAESVRQAVARAASRAAA